MICDLRLGCLVQGKTPTNVDETGVRGFAYLHLLWLNKDLQFVDIVIFQSCALLTPAK